MSQLTRAVYKKFEDCVTLSHFYESDEKDNKNNEDKDVIDGDPSQGSSVDGPNFTKPPRKFSFNCCHTQVMSPVIIQIFYVF